MLPTTISRLLQAYPFTLLQGNPEQPVTGISIDTRTLQPGDVFVAFTGTRVDGHERIEEAFSKQAAAVIISRPEAQYALQNFAHFPVLLAQDTLQAVQAIARQERDSFDGPVFGITGSNGKTTSKEMLLASLSTVTQPLGTKGNFNNELGMPLTILQRSPKDGAMVLEMGMRGRGQIAELCQIARPTCGLITNIGHSHIELLGSQEAIADAKTELFAALPADGFAIVNMDDPFLKKRIHRTKAQIVDVSLHDQTCSVYANDIQLGDEETSFTFVMNGHRHSVRLLASGLHNVQNALLVLAAASACGYEIEGLIQGMATYRPTQGRLYPRKGAYGRTILDDSYNASPLSARASLDVLKITGDVKKKWAILGDMYELGNYTEEGHRTVGEYAAHLGIPVICIGQFAKIMADAIAQAGGKCEYFPSIEEALPHLPSLLPVDSVVLVKASRGMQFEKIVEHLVNG